MSYYAGVDLGATSIRAVVGDHDETERGTDSRYTPQGPSGMAVTETVLATLRTACREADVEPDDLAAVGIGSIGPLDLAEGVITAPSNLPDHVERIPLTGPVEQLVDAPVYLHNDTTAGVIGERYYAERNPDDMVYLTISSGIGAGVCIDGHVLSGWDGNAGEVGHVTVDPSGAMACGCGKRGHWEAYCSGEGIPRYADYLHDGEPTTLDPSRPGFDAAAVFDAASEDEFADAVLERVAEWNAIGAATVVHAYAPIVIHVGGSVALENPWLVEDIQKRLGDLVMSNVPEVRLARLGEDAVVHGALASAMTGATGSRQRTRR
jgi:glucokinase